MARTTRFADGDSVGGIWLRREDEHELGSFKWRGALRVLDAKRPAVVVTASTGNHGAATAWAAARVGARAVVFVPERASAAKLALIEQQGAELRRAGADMDEAKAAARAYAAEADAFFFEDGAEPLQFEAYEAIGDGLLDDVPAPAAVVVPVGNGALAIGVFRAVARRAPDAERIAVAAAEAPAMFESWRRGSPVDSDRSATFADGLAVRVAIPLAVAELNELVHRFELVSEAELEDAVRAYAEAGIRAEGAAAAPLALARREAPPLPAVLIVTGRNIDDDLYHRILTARA
ncbi:MAG TPA: PLP-dependent lyase/thiolase [Gaiellaceae bacterium]|nr:PLP-dependent lyase/thiolase [Gaiellaceae bacterium]